MNLTSTPGRYGPFGGCYLPESLMAPIEALKTQFDACQQDPVFQQELQTRLQQYCGRPTPLTPAPQLSKRCQGATVLLENYVKTGQQTLEEAVHYMTVAPQRGRLSFLAVFLFLRTLVECRGSWPRSGASGAAALSKSVR